MEKIMEPDMQELHISVRNLVEFILRGGDIDNRSSRMVQEAMLEGGKIHRKIQKSMGSSYTAEVPLKIERIEESYILVVEGRADGIAFGEFAADEPAEQMEEQRLVDAQKDEMQIGEPLWYIDEIKGVYRNLASMEQPVYVHKAQAMCYAYIYALQNHLDRIGVQMTYCNLDTEDIRYFREIWEWENLYDWFEHLITEYKKWADWQIAWRKIRQESIVQLEFPYPYREGQRKLVADVYRTIMRRKTLFIQAPTGVGKTISTIFPAVKAVGEGLADRIFYLTAKTITATVAKETFQILREHGYQAKIIQLTAKEKLCMCGEDGTEALECNPVNCPYAKGHYDRVNDAVYDLLQTSDLFTREEILAQAKKYQVCPFEMSLDVATWVDNILCDYNYVFDPNVYLKRFFQEGIKGDYIFLVDEAHNLVDRSREMYSAQLYKEDMLAVKRIMKPHHYMIAKTLDKCNKAMLEFKRECETYEVQESVGVLTFHLMRLASQLEEFFEKPREFPEKKEVLDFYFEVRNFLNMYELVDEHYVIYTQMEEDGRFMIKLFCVDPSLNLQKCIDKANATIFFSATLLPINYYKQILSTKEDNYAIYAESTFAESQRLLAFAPDVSTKYTRRGPAEYLRIAQYIQVAVEGKEGNYMVFFPSYKMMQDVYEVFRDIAEGENPADSAEEVQDREDGKEGKNSKDGRYGRDEKNQILEICMQTSNMQEQEREQFLQMFEQEREGSLVAFCVMGGIFSEGIDLKNDKLIGAIIVGTGLPQISNERQILKDYYDERGLSGFDYAFRYPGINKVLQAAGRVIRTQEDRGIILLLDERFLQADYAPLFPREWKERKVCNLKQIKEEVKRFWKEVEQE
jgi:DNA excision repair protein ERCC-2